ncbi:MAG: UMP kinase [archaeon]
MQTVVISLGGSLIVPDNVDHEYLRKFKQVIERFIGKGFRFVIICGGGKTARKYMDAAREITTLSKDDIDWIGIHATRINAHLLKTLFRDDAHPRIVKDPTHPIDFKESILVAAGWKPGFSSDYDAVMLARNLGVEKIINLTNIDYVYDKDPKHFPEAKKIHEISWKSFRKLVGDEWDPGLNKPFDPVASKEAEKNGITVVIANGKDLNNFQRILEDKFFQGTIIS